MPGGNKGFRVSKLPSEYPLTEQQKAFREANEYCEIKKGISRAEMMDKMKNCIPEFWRKRKQQEQGE